MIFHCNINRWVSPTLRAGEVRAARVFAGVRRRWAAIGFAAVGAAVMLVLIVAWWCYAWWRSGRVELIAEEESVVVQVLDEATEEPVGEPVGLVDRVVIELPAGEYKLRVEGKGRLSRTFRFSVNRGETLAHSISIDEGRLLGGEPGPDLAGQKRTLPMRIPASTAAGGARAQSGKG